MDARIKKYLERASSSFLMTAYFNFTLKAFKSANFCKKNHSMKVHTSNLYGFFLHKIENMLKI